MNLRKMIAELQSERDRLDEAILALERLSALGHGRAKVVAAAKLAAVGGVKANAKPATFVPKPDGPPSA